MQFSSVVAVALAAVAVSAAPAPELAERASCKGGNAYCKQSAGKWSKCTSQSQTCPGGNVYCCIVQNVLLSVADCTDILDNNTVEVPIDLLPNLTINL